MADIARAAGVSRATVSAVLNGKDAGLGIKPATAAKIRRTAEKMGYFRNEMAVAVRTGRYDVIGCLTFSLDSEWGARVFAGFLRQAQQEGFLVKVEHIVSGDDIVPSLRRMISLRMAGVFCCEIQTPRAVAREFNELALRHELPLVGVNCGPDLTGDRIASDDRLGAQLAVGHLWELGHRRIAHISGNPDVLTSREREAGFRAALEERGQSRPLVEPGRYDLALSYEAARRLLARKTGRPTAIFCANDDVAALCLRVAADLGLRVPQDLSVVGFSDSRIAELTTPPLTTVHQPFERMGARSAEALVRRIRRPGEPARVEWLENTLVLRASSAAPPSRRRG